jgi:hypothetical protein
MFSTRRSSVEYGCRRRITSSCPCKASLWSSRTFTYLYWIRKGRDLPRRMIGCGVVCSLLAFKKCRLERRPEPRCRWNTVPQLCHSIHDSGTVFLLNHTLGDLALLGGVKLLHCSLARSLLPSLELKSHQSSPYLAPLTTSENRLRH